MYYFNSNSNNNNTNDDSNNDRIQYNNQNYNDMSSEYIDNSLPVNHQPIFDVNYNNWNFSNTTPDSSQQDAILFSDSNFLRQQQLLQEESHNAHSSPETNPILISNLSAMFNQPAEQQTEYEEEKPNIMSCASQQNQQDDLNAKINHQKRLTELQARFRVNYPRKPNNTSNNHVKLENTTTTENENTGKSLPIANSKPIPSTSPATTNGHDSTGTASPRPTPPHILPTNGTDTTTNIAMNYNNTSTSLGNTATESLLSSSFPSRTMPIKIHRVSKSNILQTRDIESQQKLLDSQLEKVDFDDITVSELKEMLRQRGKPATGKKAVLLQRLQEEHNLVKNSQSWRRGSYGSSYGHQFSSSNNNNHHQSQPLLFSRSIDSHQHQVPLRSFQDSNNTSNIPITNHNSNNVFISNSPSSPNNNIMPGSPSGTLHRSIANMHIGSPPVAVNGSRRYSPYSPRLSSSPKPVYHEYSSSLPNDAPTAAPVIVPSENNDSSDMMLSSSYSALRSPTNRYYNNHRSYKPFMSSALATPDREEDENPFDSYYANEGHTMKKEEILLDKMNNTQKRSNDVNTIAAMATVKKEEVDMNGDTNGSMDWLNEPVDMLLGQDQTFMLGNEQMLTNEQIMALLDCQQQATAFDFRLDDSNLNH